MTDPQSAPYRLQVTGPAAHAMAGKLPEKIATAVYEFINATLVGNPHRVGKRLILPPFEGTWSARRGTYRVLYEIDEDDLVVTVTAIVRDRSQVIREAILAAWRARRDEQLRAEAAAVAADSEDRAEARAALADMDSLRPW